VLTDAQLLNIGQRKVVLTIARIINIGQRKAA